MRERNRLTNLPRNYETISRLSKEGWGYLQQSIQMVSSSTRVHATRVCSWSLPAFRSPLGHASASVVALTGSSSVYRPLSLILALLDLGVY